MLDLSLLRRSSLSDAKTGRLGASMADGSRIVLRALPQGHVLQVLAAQGADATPLLSTIGERADHAVRAAGPGQWFVVGDRPLSAAELTEKKAVLAGKASIADQSHGRTRIAVEGKAVEKLLAKGTAVDLASSAFPVGTSAITLIGHISTHLTRTGDDAFEILVLRGFAESLWEDLIQMGLEFGVEAQIVP